MSKVLVILTQLILFTALFISLSQQTALAASCTFTYRPNPPNQNMGNLDVTINSDALKSGIYRIQGDRPNNSGFHIRDINFTGGSANITITPPTIGWLAGTYKLYFIEQNKTGTPQTIASCQTSFTIQDVPVSSCKATIESKPIDPDTGVVLAVEGINSGSYDIYINNEHKFTNSIASGDKVVLGNFDVGTYTVAIKSRCGVLGIDCAVSPPRLQCNIESFVVAARGSGGGGRVGTGPGGAVPAATPCTGPDCSKGGGEPCGDNDHPAFKTAIGCIHTNPVEFVKDFLTFIIAISGGFAFLMMLLGAFQMITSAGNPDTLNAGRERLTSAIIGLLFVIFAVLLMQIIGISILNIPGFTQP